MTEEKDRDRAPACLAPPSSHPFPQETPDRKPTQRTSSQNPYTPVKDIVVTALVRRRPVVWPNPLGRLAC
jgi:hypothetical protein